MVFTHYVYGGNIFYVPWTDRNRRSLFAAIIKIASFRQSYYKKIRGAFGQCSSVQTVCRAINFIYILTELKKIAIKC